MRQAYLEAEKAFALGEIPVGAVVVANNQIIARSRQFHREVKRCYSSC